MRSHHVISICFLAATLGACSSHEESGCNRADPGACSGGAVCEPLAGGGTACVAPLVVKGQVTDLVTGAAVAGARVVALDPNRAPASPVATTDAGGNYTLNVQATRASNGAPAAEITLRADAQNYQSFPGGIRSALPIDLSTATSSDGHWEFQGALTNVGLIPLPDTSTLLSISGTLQQPATRVGLLVVAEPQAGGTGLTAIAGSDGSYKIFNVPAAASPGISYEVKAYGRGVNYTPQTATLTLGSTPPTVDLTLKNATTATINGSLIFNSGAATPTSVALVVESTYDAVLDRGESPPLLVAQVPSGSTYTLAGVPDGTYIALAAFGIDGDVRDVSDTGNTAPVEVVIQNGALVGTLGQFKLVGAIELTSIDGVAVGSSGVPIQLRSDTPEFVWAKAPSYASADTFQIEVFDAFGKGIWTYSQSGSGSGPFTATYGSDGQADPLQSGMYYQLRIKALDGATPIPNALSQTEDLKGVFFKP
jgi:hypothetical protein